MLRACVCVCVGARIFLYTHTGRQYFNWPNKIETKNKKKSRYVWNVAYAINLNEIFYCYTRQQRKTECSLYRRDDVIEQSETATNNNSNNRKIYWREYQSIANVYVRRISRNIVAALIVYTRSPISTCSIVSVSDFVIIVIVITTYIIVYTSPPTNENCCIFFSSQFSHTTHGMVYGCMMMLHGHGQK